MWQPEARDDFRGILPRLLLLAVHNKNQLIHHRGVPGHSTADGGVSLSQVGRDRHIKKIWLVNFVGGLGYMLWPHGPRVLPINAGTVRLWNCACILGYPNLIAVYTIALSGYVDPYGWTISLIWRRIPKVITKPLYVNLSGLLTVMAQQLTDQGSGNSFPF